MRVRLSLILAALSWAILIQPAAAADNDWMQDVLGAYSGPVLNGPGIERMFTEFELDGAGKLIGHYHIDDPQPFAGELTDFRQDGPRSGDFTWQDHFGQGVVHVIFDPDHGRFLGLWGSTEPLEGHVFNGYRSGPSVGS